MHRMHDFEVNQGVVVSVRGSVVVVRFDQQLPPIYSVLRAGDQQQIVIEVLSQQDARTVRGIALTPTRGLSDLEERIANTDTGAITSIQAVYVPADDFTDPATVHTFSHLSASIVLSRKRASEGLFPAIDPLQSSSKMATPSIVGQRHYQLAQEIRRTLAKYADLKDIIAMLGLEQLSPEDRRVVGRARRLERFLTPRVFNAGRATTERAFDHRKTGVDNCASFGGAAS